MKRNLLILMLSLLVVASCKKNKDTSTTTKTTAELLIGEWDINHEAYDDNNNGTLEQSEIYIRTGDQQWKFEDGLAAMTYYVSGSPQQAPYSWTISDNKVSMTMNGDQTPSKHLLIEEISETEVRWKDGDYWRMYTRKQ